MVFDAVRDFASDLVDWVWTMLRHWQAYLASLAVGGGFLVWEHYYHEHIPWTVAWWILAFGFFVASFLAWREARDDAASLQSLLEAVKIPAFDHTVIRYVWVGESGPDIGVLIELDVFNTGFASKLGDWEVALDATDREHAGEVGRILPEIARGSPELRRKANIADLTKTRAVVHGHGVRGIIWAMFAGFASEASHVNAAMIRVMARDENGKRYVFTPSVRAIKRAENERGSAAPYPGVDSMARFRRGSTPS